MCSNQQQFTSMKASAGERQYEVVKNCTSLLSLINDFGIVIQPPTPRRLPNCKPFIKKIMNQIKFYSVKWNKTDWTIENTSIWYGSLHNWIIILAFRIYIIYKCLSFKIYLWSNYVLNKSDVPWIRNQFSHDYAKFNCNQV